MHSCVNFLVVLYYRHGKNVLFFFQVRHLLNVGARHDFSKHCRCFDGKTRASGLYAWTPECLGLIFSWQLLGLMHLAGDFYLVFARPFGHDFEPHTELRVKLFTLSKIYDEL